jgi:ribonuclease HI
MVLIPPRPVVPMHVTVIADASLCPETDVGGYGYWIACDRGKQPGSGVLTGPIGNSTIAELMAIWNALNDGINLHLIRRNDIVLIQTDSLGAISCLEKKSARELQGLYRKLYEEFHKLVIRYQLIVNFRHVKGHTNIREPRYAANRACDFRAKEAMRFARSRYKVENK